MREHLIRQILEISTTKKARRRQPSSGRIAQAAAQPLRIFLSATREDRDRVVLVYHALKNAGYEPWLDVENLLPGQDWELEIRHAIQESDVVLAFLSRHSVVRKSFVNRELRIALDTMQTLPDGTVFLIPVRLDDVVDVPEPLRAIQWVDLFAPGGMEFLLNSLRAISQRSHARAERKKKTQK